jgi:hypothetical protein
LTLALTLSAGLAFAGEKLPHVFVGDDPDVAKSVTAELALAKKGKARTVVLDVVATDEWGCDCAPFVYAPYADSAPESGPRFVFPVTASGPNPAAHTIGSSAGMYELTGKFTTTQLTERAWRKKIKQGNHGDKKAKQPVFAVESWCFAPVKDMPEQWVEVLAEMRQAGVAMCK